YQHAGPSECDGLPIAFKACDDGHTSLLIDRQSGLLAYAPIYWLVPVCWAMTWRRTWPFLVPALLLYLPMAAFVEWWGGFSPAARYLVPLIPLAAVPIALAMRSIPIRIAALALAVPQLAIDASVWQHPRALWPPDSGLNPALESLGAAGRAYEWLLPSIRRDGITAAAIRLVIAVAAIVAASVKWAQPIGDVRPWRDETRA